jgi:hypothetical protein
MATAKTLRVPMATAKTPRVPMAMAPMVTPLGEDMATTPRMGALVVTVHTATGTRVS